MTQQESVIAPHRARVNPARGQIAALCAAGLGRATRQCTPSGGLGWCARCTAPCSEFASERFQRFSRSPASGATLPNEHTPCLEN